MTADLHNNTQPENASRVVALINPVLHCRSTCCELITRGVNLVGIVEEQTKAAGLPLRTLRRLARQQGFVTTTSQIAARMLYLLKNRRQDAVVYQKLFNREHIETVLRTWRGTIIPSSSYGDETTIQAIRSLRPDILVVHSQSWVPKRVRELAAADLVLGGHPGLTPWYRGSHSSFWALLQQQPERLGWTAFHVDRGVDTGDVVVQGRLQVEPGDSFMTLNWRGMKEIAVALADAILEYDRTGHIPRHPHRQIPPNTQFGQPTFRQYLTYRRQQNLVR